MIVLDTNALLWLHTGHARARRLQTTSERLYVSPVSLLELTFLEEAGKLRLVPGSTIDDVAADRRWQVDSPATDVLFRAAIDHDWTRDPFDRLIAAHAACRRWRLATGDRAMLAALPLRSVLAL